MSKQPWWRRIVTRVYVRTPKPQPPKPSPQGIARRQGWVKIGAGHWTHDTLGTVERERDGMWACTTTEERTTGWRTMQQAMQRAQDEAYMLALQPAADVLAELRPAAGGDAAAARLLDAAREHAERGSCDLCDGGDAAAQEPETEADRDRAAADLWRQIDPPMVEAQEPREGAA